MIQTLLYIKEGNYYTYGHLFIYREDGKITEKTNLSVSIKGTEIILNYIQSRISETLTELK